MQLIAVKARVRGQRHRAAAAHAAAHGALGGHDEPAGQVRQGAERSHQVGAVTAHLDAQGALASGGQHLGGGELGADALAQAQALEAGGRQHDGVVLAFIELAQARVEVAAQWLDFQVRAQRVQQHLAAQARRADHGALRQLAQAGIAWRNKGVARVFALHHAGQGKAVGQHHGHVLERVHGDVRAAVL